MSAPAVVTVDADGASQLFADVDYRKSRRPVKAAYVEQSWLFDDAGELAAIAEEHHQLF